MHGNDAAERARRHHLARLADHRQHGREGGVAVEASTEPLPALSLLSMPTQPEDLITAADLTSEANLLVAKLADFDIHGRVTEIHPGPVVTTTTPGD